MVPSINAEFKKYGSNKGNLIILAVTNNQTTSQLISYMSIDNYFYPGISIDNGGKSGKTIHSDYGINALPTLILIAPNKRVVEKDMWPIGTLSATLKKYDFSTGINTSEKLIGNDFKVILAHDKVKFELAIDGYYSWNICSVNGRLIDGPFNGFISKGEHWFTLDNNLSKGVYLLRIQYGNSEKFEKIVVK